MKYLLFCLLGFSSYFSYSAERDHSLESATVAQIHGVVTDASTGEKLTGVAVYVGGLNQTVYTGFDGEYEVQLPFEGKYDITLRLASYQQQSAKQVLVQGNSEMSLNLALHRD